MAQIQPFQVWKDGQQQQAESIVVVSVYDNLVDQAKFFFQLLDANSQEVAAGNLPISGQDYIDWGLNQDINLAAYSWVAAQLNITLI